MLDRVFQMIRQTVTDPKEGAETVLALGLPRGTLWLGMGLVVVLTVIMYRAGLMIAPRTPGVTPQLPDSPFMLAIMIWGLLALSAYCLYFIGRAFGGTGKFEEALSLVIWLQVVLLAFQVIQLLLMTVSPVLAVFLGAAVFLLSIWIFVNFISVLHGFRSLAMVFVGLLISGFGVMVGLSILLAILALFFGVEVPNV